MAWCCPKPRLFVDDADPLGHFFDNCVDISPLEVSFALL